MYGPRLRLYDLVYGEEALAVRTTASLRAAQMALECRQHQQQQPQQSKDDYRAMKPPVSERVIGTKIKQPDPDCVNLVDCRLLGRLPELVVQLSAALTFCLCSSECWLLAMLSFARLVHGGVVELMPASRLTIIRRMFTRTNGSSTIWYIGCMFLRALVPQVLLTLLSFEAWDRPYASDEVD